MSKLLAMMMKPKEYMYATIKGSLTDNNGVFSGFSSSNYLALQQPFTLNADTIAEIKLKINVSSFTNSGFIGTLNYYGLTIGISTTNKLQILYGESGSWKNQISGNNVLITNTDYYVKINIDKKNLVVSISTDNVNYTTDISQTLNIETTQILSFSLGIGRTSSSYFNGSINLNQSYIKINNTKYQLQAVVGYTVVGSPTITDGMVSGFSSSDYLTLPNLNFASNNTEIVIKFTTEATISNQLILNIGSNQLYISSSYHLTFKISYGGNKWLTGTSIIQPNTTYYAKFINTSDGCSLYLSTDNINWILDRSTTNFHITSNAIVYIGAGNTGYTNWSGSIDLNETYIKINNKLWFNGQPAS